MANKKYPIAKADMKKVTKKVSTAKTKPKGKIMVCPKCKKDFAEGIKAAYKLGLLDGGNRSQQTINCLKKTNGHLWNELTRLDKYQPLEENAIKLSVQMAESIIKSLKRKGYHKQAKKIVRLVEAQKKKHIIIEQFELDTDT